MRKETLIAIILGIAAGIGIAFFLVRQSGNSPKNNNVILDKITPTVAIDTSEIEPLIIQSPESGIVTSQNSIDVTIAAPKNSLIVFQTLTQEITLSNKERSVTQKLKLLPGENNIKITAYKDKNVDSRSMVVYSMTSTYDSSTSSKKDTSTSDNSKTNEDSTIESLKEKIEKKVDELNQGNKNVVAGTISKISDQTINVTSDGGDQFSVAYDDTITEVYKVNLDEKESISFDDLSKGDRVVISGPSIEKQISANLIYVQESYILGQGVVASLDGTAFTLDVLTQEKDNYTLDIEDDTVQRIMNVESLDVAKSGFSKIKVGDTIHFAIPKKENDKAEKVTAVRTFIIPQEYFVEEK